ncbi:MAG: hypothetical protein AAB834_01500 [Patescibacteria group bacterium]
MKKHISQKSFRSFRTAGVVTILVFSFILPVIYDKMVSAADLTQSMVRFDRIMISAPTTGTVCAKPATVATEASVQVTFPTGYTLGVAGTFTVDTTNLAWPTGGTVWPGIATANDVSGQVVTFASGELTVGTLYCFNWINSAAVTVKSSATSSNAGSITTRTSAPATIDSASYTTASVNNDQIAVTASIPSAFSFALSANSDDLGALSTGAVSTSPTPRTATINTNAKNGWMVWAKDANTGLTSVSASSTIASTTPGTNSTLSAGTEGYNTGFTSSQVGGTGTISITAPFVGTAAGQGGGLDTGLRTVATSTGTADTAVLTIKNNAAINPTTEAATDYSDTITIIGAGLF